MIRVHDMPAAQAGGSQSAGVFEVQSSSASVPRSRRAIGGSKSRMGKGKTKQRPPLVAARGCPVSPLDKKLDGEYGPMVMLNDKGRPVGLNQQHVAARFAALTRLVFDAATRLFYRYEDDSGLWRTVSEDKLAVEIGAMVRARLKESLVLEALGKCTSGFLRQVVAHLRGMVDKPDAFAQRAKAIHVANGMLCLEDGRLRLQKFAADNFSRNRSEIKYDPKAKCPRFLGELLEPVLPADDISLLQRYAGQCLLGRNPSQRILLLLGTPGGGKGTVVNIIEQVIGSHNVVELRVPQLTGRFEIASFVGRTLLCGKDVSSDFLNGRGAGALKKLVGGDRLSAERKGVNERFEVVGDFNAIITANSRLMVKLDGDSGAWKRRLAVVDYERPGTTKPIEKFDAELVEQEGPGILNWMVEGAVQALADMKEHGRTVLTERQQQRVEDLLNEADVVRNFACNCVVKEEAADVTVHELTLAFQPFCAEWGGTALTARQFENRIGSVMLEVCRVAKRTDIQREGRNQRGFAHVALKQEVVG